MNRVQEFQKELPKGFQAPIPLEVRAASTDIMLFGLEYMREGETEFIRVRPPEVKARIGYAEYLREKSKEKWSTSTDAKNALKSREPQREETRPKSIRWTEFRAWRDS